MGSSAGAGSGEFHVYRHLRRKEYARQKHMKLLSEKEILDIEFQEKLENNQRIADEKTNKKRQKRLKKKSKQKNKTKKPKIEEQNSESDDEELSGSDKEVTNDDENSEDVGESTKIHPAEKDENSPEVSVPEKPETSIEHQELSTEKDQEMKGETIENVEEEDK